MSHEKLKCTECDYIAINLLQLINHYPRKHKKHKKFLFIDMHLNGIHPTCKCGCGAETAFKSINLGFKDFVKGHVARIMTKLHDNLKNYEKGTATRTQLYKKGKMVSWSKGKTKEELPGLMKVSQKQKIHHAKPEVKKFHSDRMKRFRKDGTMPNLKGENHSKWKGGISPIHALINSQLRYYNLWKKPILIRDNYKCIKCFKSDGKLHIHHDKERFAEIFQKIRIQENYNGSDDFNEKTRIANLIIDYHIDNNISGIALCKSCHAQEHKNDKNNSFNLLKSKKS